jgi:histidine ammonia-lyase
VRTDHGYPKNITEVVLDGETLDIEQVVAVARNTDVRVKLAKEAKERVKRSEEWVRKVAEGRVRRDGTYSDNPLPNDEKLIVYGINTGFGCKSSSYISNDSTKRLQRNLILSHSAGVGEPLDEEIVRAAMLLRANTLAKGVSGIRVEVIQTLIDMLRNGVHPIIPSKGSVCASGDLAPLSHLALVISRDPDDEEDKEEDSGEAFHEGKRMSGKQAMAAAGIDRVKLNGKEGLALNNGTQVTTAIGVLTLYDAENLIKTAEIAAAMSLDALRGNLDAFHKKVHLARPHPGQIDTARHIRALVKGSKFINSNPDKVQDAYSLRCIPQVLGAARDTIKHVREVLSIEINSATDNPLIFLDLDRRNKAISCGNFHGEPIAMAMDFLGIAIAEVGNISERRTFKLTNKDTNEGLPSQLVENNGLNSGFMIAQYTAAALVSENKTLAHPASVDSIPTSEHFEDHVSMGTFAALKTREILYNAENTIAIELLCAAQASDLRVQEMKLVERDGFVKTRLGSGVGIMIAYNTIREKVSVLEYDRALYKDIDKTAHLIRKGGILENVEKALKEVL